MSVTDGPEVIHVHERGWEADLTVRRAGSTEVEFAREARLWLYLDPHPNVCTAQFVRELDGAPALFAEHPPGCSTLAALTRDRLDVAAALDIAIQASRGLAHLHANRIVWCGALSQTDVLCCPGGDAKLWLGGNIERSEDAERRAQDVLSVVAMLSRLIDDTPEIAASSMPDLADELVRIYEHRLAGRYPRARPAEAALTAGELANRGAAFMTIDASGARTDAEWFWSRALKVDPLQPEATFGQDLVHWRRRKIADDHLMRRVAATGAPDLVAAAETERHVVDEVRTLDHGDEIGAVALSGDGVRAIMGTVDGIVRLWDTASGRCLQSMRGHHAAIRSAAITTDGRRALTAARDGTAILWDLETASALNLPGDRGDRGPWVAFAPARSAVVVATADEIALWDDDDGRLIERFAHDVSDATALAVSGDGTRAFLGSADGTVYGVNLTDSDAPWYTDSYFGHRGAVVGIAKASGEGLLSVGTDGVAFVWNDYGDPHDSFDVFDSDYVALSASADLSVVLAGTRDARMRVFDGGRCVRTLEAGSAAISALAMTPDGRTALSGCRDGIARVWTITGGRPAPFALARPAASD